MNSSGNIEAFVIDGLSPKLDSRLAITRFGDVAEVTWLATQGESYRLQEQAAGGEWVYASGTILGFDSDFGLDDSISSQPKLFRLEITSQ